MALRTTLETLEGVDDALKPFYTENGETFVLQLEGIDSHPDVANLKSAYERVKADKATAIQERDAFKEKVSSLPDDFDPDKWEKIKDGKPDEAALITLRQKLEKERDDALAEATNWQKTARKTALERDLTDALTEAGVTNATFAKAARTMIEPSVKLTDDGKAIVETDMGPLGLVEHVKRWAASDGKDFVTPPAGGGAKGGNGKGSAKTVSRSQFDEMGQRDRAAFAKEGGKVVDD